MLERLEEHLAGAACRVAGIEATSGAILAHAPVLEHASKLLSVARVTNTVGRGWRL